MIYRLIILLVMTFFIFLAISCILQNHSYSSNTSSAWEASEKVLFKKKPSKNADLKALKIKKVEFCGGFPGTQLTNLLNILTIKYQNYFRKKPPVPGIDILELSYLKMDKEKENVFFQVIRQRYENSSLIITTNLPMSREDEVFTGQLAANAILDRLVHHFHVLSITGDSFCVKGEKYISELEKTSKPTKQTVCF